MKPRWILFLATPAAIAAGWIARDAWERSDPLVQASPSTSLTEEPQPSPPVANEVTTEQPAELVTEEVEEAPLPNNAQDRWAELAFLANDSSFESQLRKMRLVEQMSSAELQQFIEEAPVRDVMDEVIGQWVKLNPQAAFENLLEKNGSGHGSPYTIFNHFGKHDPDKGFQLLKQLSGNTKRSALNALIGSVVFEDPQRALRLVKQVDEDKHLIPSAYHNLFSNWARVDPAAAQAAIESLPQGKAKTHALQGFLQTYASSNPSEAWHLSMEMPPSYSRYDALRSAYQHWYQEDPIAAETALSEIESPLLRGNLLQRLSWSLPKDDPLGVIDMIAHLSDGQKQDQATSGYLNTIAQNDPEGAAAVIEQMPYGKAYKDSMRNLIQQWSQRDPVAALQWLNQQPDGEEKHYAYSSLMNNYVKHDPNAAVALFTETDFGDKQVEIGRNLMRELAKNDPESAYNLALTMEDENVRSQMETRLIQELANIDHAQALDFLTQHELPLDQNRASNIARNWAAKHPEEAAAWALSLEDVGQQKSSVSQVASSWLQHDPYAASVWISELPEGDTRDSAINSLTSIVRSYEPEVAFDWAMEISNEDQRIRDLGWTLRKWKQDDPEAALAAIEGSDLSPEQIEKLKKDYLQ
ncbi:hypothetical protein [Cerasicoccus fimbriatus]|uniref:hypothetical protein n=1 Tax=Cerasicoccus fimbriatus TaxID=3014554 RepID=UPI0022B5950C|nr:hypothetical protein [Cerasicoccus sp. TK19100]